MTNCCGRKVPSLKIAQKLTIQKKLSGCLSLTKTGAMQNIKAIPIGFDMDASVFARARSFSANLQDFFTFPPNKGCKSRLDRVFLSHFHASFTLRPLCYFSIFASFLTCRASIRDRALSLQSCSKLHFLFGTMKKKLISN